MTGNVSRHTRIADVAVYLPDGGMTTDEVETRLSERNPGVEVPAGLIERLTGVAYRHVALDDWMASDLAVAASRKLLEVAEREIDDIDLLIFAATSADTIEPATAHIVADKLGARCPVFDITNACNSVMNAIEVADALIRAGQYDRVLIACGERITPGARWRVTSMDDYVNAVVSHTTSDAGAALLMEVSDAPGVLVQRFTAESEAWRATAVPVIFDLENGGVRAEGFAVNTMELMAAMDKADLAPLLDTLSTSGLSMSDFAVICVHQAALPYLAVFCERAGIPLDRTVVTIGEHGNVGSASLPLQLVTARETGRLKRGDRALLFGLAAGLSLGVVAVRW